MNRPDQKFQELRAHNQKAFIAYVTAGDPNLETTERLVIALEQSGASIVELGVPFSDPMADGPTIQAASQRVLQHHINLPKIFELARRIRQRSQIPLVLMTYYNPVFHYGEAKFVADAKGAGIDGVIVPDLPPEEASGLLSAAKKANFSTTFLIAPTTLKERIKTIADASSSFVYYVSLTGVTGLRQDLSTSIGKDLKTIKKFTKKPVCIGFGISSEDHVRQVAPYADGVIVGSAIVKEIEKHAGQANCVEQTAAFVGRLVRALK